MIAPADPLNIAAWNTHVGAGIRNGGLRFIRDTIDPDAYLLSEVQSPFARASLRTFFGTGWKIYGLQPPSFGRGASGTMIVTRKKRLRFITGTNRLVSPYRDRMHPQRRCTVGWYEDKQTGEDLMLVSIHTWVALEGAPTVVRQGHDTQVNTYAATCRAGRADGAVVIAGGDANERVGNPDASRIGEAMRAAGMYDSRDWTVHGTMLDAVWVSKGTRSHGWHAVRVPGNEPQHPAIVVKVVL